MNKKNDFKNILFKSLFSTICIIIFSLVVLIAILFNYFCTKNAASQSIIIANNACFTLERTMYANIAALESLSQNAQLRSTLRNVSDDTYIEQIEDIHSTNKLLDTFNFSRSEITNILMFSPKVSSDSLPFRNFLPLSLLVSSKTFSSYAALNSAIITEGAPYISNNIYDDTLGCDRSAMSLMVRVTDADDTLLGYLFVCISKDYLYKNYLPGDNSSEIVIGVQNDIILNSDRIDNMLNQKQHDIMNTSDSGYLFDTINGVSQLIIHSQANSYGWKVVFYNPTSAVCTWRIYVFLYSALALIILILIAYMYSSWISGTVTTPISQIINSMKELRPCVDKQYVQEFNTLSDVYNHLLEEQEQLLISIKKETKKSNDAEIKALLAQINPHFLYNTLNAIGYHSLDGDAQSTCNMISKLSRLCKINYNFKNITTIKSELLQVNLYLDLQTECFNKSFTFTVDAPESCLEYKIPSFIIQPIVENTIIHGFSETNRANELKIMISINEDITILVKDNGSGIAPNILDMLNNNEYYSEKYGIYNINNRIKMLCGSKYGISFKSGSSWTTAIITLPIDEFLGDEDV